MGAGNEAGRRAGRDGMNDSVEWLGIAGIAILLAWYALAASWLARRRHVPAPPPADAVLSPAEMRFLYTGVFDGRTLLVAILDLVAKGALSLKQRPNGTSYLESALDAVGNETLPEDAALVRGALFRAGNRMVDLTDAREDALLHTGFALRSWLARRYVSDPNLSRSAWLWLLLVGGALAAGSIVAMAGRDGGYGMEMAALTVVFYIFGLASIGTAILFVQQFRSVILVLKLVIVFTLIPAWPVLLVLVAGNLIDFHGTHGIVGSALFALPVIGSFLLLYVGRPRFEMPTSAMRQMDDWYARLQAPARTDAHAPCDDANAAGSASAPIDPLSVVAIAFDAGDPGRLGSIFDDLRFPSDRINLFGARKHNGADLGSVGQIATR
jgi:hypothetical protein